MKENSRNSRWFSIKNPVLLVSLGLTVGIIISNLVHNEYNASKKLTRQSNALQLQQQIQSQKVELKFYQTIQQQDSNFEIIRERTELQSPIIEYDHPSEDLNDQVQFSSNNNNNNNQLNQKQDENRKPKKPFVFIFIGIISGRENFEQREAVRDAWSRDCNNQKHAKCQFILSQDNQTNQINNQSQIGTKLLLENQKNDDMVFVNSEEGYINLAQKTLALFQFVAQNYNASFLLKTDDDAFVFPDRLHDYLLKYCPKLVCPDQKLFIGSEKRESEVILQTSDPKGGGKWENYKYYEQTGLSMYLPYMLGGGYVLSGSIVDVLTYTFNRTGLVMTKMEDATVGLWLGGMEVKWIDDSRSFVTMGLNCCFSRTRIQQHPVLGYFRLLADICRSQPRRIILHAVKNVTQMRYLGEVYRNRCKLKPVKEII